MRELLAGARRFNEIRRGVPRLSPTLLKERLRTLERAGIVERVPTTNTRGSDYQLTQAGEELRAVIALRDASTLESVSEHLRNAAESANRIAAHIEIAMSRQGGAQ